MDTAEVNINLNIITFHFNHFLLKVQLQAPKSSSIMKIFAQCKDVEDDDVDVAMVNTSNKSRAMP